MKKNTLAFLNKLLAQLLSNKESLLFISKSIDISEEQQKTLDTICNEIRMLESCIKWVSEQKETEPEEQFHPNQTFFNFE